MTSFENRSKNFFFLFLIKLLPFNAVNSGRKLGSRITGIISPVQASPRPIPYNDTPVHIIILTFANCIDHFPGHLVAVLTSILEVFCKVRSRVLVGFVNASHQVDGTLNIVHLTVHMFTPHLPGNAMKSVVIRGNVMLKDRLVRDVVWKSQIVLYILSIFRKTQSGIRKNDDIFW